MLINKVIKWSILYSISIVISSIAFAGGIFVNKQKYPVPKEFKESPMLAKRVAIGDIPSIENRIPKEPFVLTRG